MNTRTQLLVSAAIVLAAAGTVAVYGIVASPSRAAAGPAVHDHAAMGAAVSDSSGRPVRLDAEAARRIGVTYAVARMGAVGQSVQTVGTVAWDETRLASVTPRIEGWIERLYADFTGAPVTRGQPLMEVYSPMLVAAQEELLLAKRLADQQAASGAASVLDAQDLLVSARRRLRALDLTPGEIAAVERSGTPRRTVTLRAPASGVVVEKTAVVGARVMPGMELYRIADLSRVWVDGEVFEKDLSIVRIGQHATVTFEAYPGESFDAVVSYVYPTVAMDSRTGRVRLALDNPGGRLKPGMYARIDLRGPAARTALLVPRSAVHSTGERSLVFVRQADGALAPRSVTLGAVAGNDVEVVAGLSAGETVVASANFLIDAESNMGSAMGSMPGMEMNPSPSPAPATSAPTPVQGTRAMPGTEMNRSPSPATAEPAPAPTRAMPGMEMPSTPPAPPRAGHGR